MPEPAETGPSPRPIGSADLPAILALNNAHARELSLLDNDSLAGLLAAAFHARCVDGADAFLIALPEGADYHSPNYLWFKSRRDRFVYVDRVVVAASARGRGLARTLYRGLFEAAAAAGYSRICCEVNSDPPNPGSDRFHAALGFAEVGRADLADRGKSVRYLECAL